MKKIFLGLFLAVFFVMACAPKQPLSPPMPPPDQTSAPAINSSENKITLNILYKETNLWRFHDEEKKVTCWFVPSQVIFCLPDSAIQGNDR